MYEPSPQPRDRVSAHGTFLSIPSVFDGADEGVQHAFKMEISPVVTRAQGTGKDTRHTFGATFLTDRALIDLGAVEHGAFDLAKVDRDCELLRAAIRDHPDVVRRALAAVAGEGGDADEIEAATEALEAIGMTEQHIHEQGGGIIGLIVLACALALCAGCYSCGSQGTSGHRPPEHPQTLPADAGPG